MAGTDTLVAVQSALITAGVGQKTASGTDWMIYRGYLQDGPDRAICLYETPGLPPLEAWSIDYPGVQIAVRGGADEYTLVRNKIQAAFAALHAQETAIGTDFVYFYAMQSAPLQMGLDEKRRPKLVWNFRSMRNRVSA